MLRGDDLVFLQVLLRRGGSAAVAGNTPSPKIRALVESGHCALSNADPGSPLQIMLTDAGRAALLDLIVDAYIEPLNPNEV